MDEDKISIEINSVKYSFVIKTGEVSDLKIVFPMICSISSEFKKDENGIYNLKLYDKITCFHLHEEEVKWGFSLNPTSRKIKIIIPNDWITDLDVFLENGDLLLKDMILNQTSISSLKGKITVKDSHSDYTSIDGIKSDICLQRVNGLVALINTCTGNLKLNNNDFDRFDCKTETGNIGVEFLNHQLKNTSVYIKDKKTMMTSEEGKQLKKKFKFVSDFGKVSNNLF